MSEDEELELLEIQEKERFNMLESILSIRRGYSLFFESFRSLLKGDAAERRLIDESRWSMVNGRLPESRRDELRINLRNMTDRYLNRESVRALHLLWHTVENLGREIFEGINKCRELVSRRSKLMNLLEDDPIPLQTGFLNHLALEESPMFNSFRVWNLHPRFTSIQNELDIIEVKSGSSLHIYSIAAIRFEKAFSRNTAILERFAEANLKLVVSKVRKYHPCGIMEEMDLIQEGCQGLMEAVRRFDHNRGCKLSTFAVWWIRQYIIKAIIRHSRLVRVPATMRSEHSSINRAIDEFSSENSRMPSMDELSAYTGKNRDEIEHIHLTSAPPLSLDHTGEAHDATIADFLESRFNQPDSEAIHSDARKRIDTALASLSDRDKTIITLRFGFLDGEPCTLQEIGRIFGISRERVRQLEARALSRLRDHGLLSTLTENGNQ